MPADEAGAPLLEPDGNVLPRGTGAQPPPDPVDQLPLTPQWHFVKEGYAARVLHASGRPASGLVRPLRVRTGSLVLVPRVLAIPYRATARETNR